VRLLPHGPDHVDQNGGGSSSSPVAIDDSPLRPTPPFPSASISLPHTKHKKDHSLTRISLFLHAGIQVDYVTLSDRPEKIANILSEGGGPEELFLTFSYELDRDVEPGSKEETEVWAAIRVGVARSVEGAVKAIREKKLDGSL
jgi:hypothetical protein